MLKRGSLGGNVFASINHRERAGPAKGTATATAPHKPVGLKGSWKVNRWAVDEKGGQEGREKIVQGQ